MHILAVEEIGVFEQHVSQWMI